MEHNDKRLDVRESTTVSDGKQENCGLVQDETRQPHQTVDNILKQDNMFGERSTYLPAMTQEEPIIDDWSKDDILTNSEISLGSVYASQNDMAVLEKPICLDTTEEIVDTETIKR